MLHRTLEDDKGSKKKKMLEWIKGTQYVVENVAGVGCAIVNSMVSVLVHSREL